jgi:hypothetical protein
VKMLLRQPCTLMEEEEEKNDMENIPCSIKVKIAKQRQTT